MPMGEIMNLKQVGKKIKYIKATKKRKANPEDHRKSHTKYQWRYGGIVLDDFDKSYNEYTKTSHCEYCDEPFLKNKDRQMDHDHDIKYRHNARGILCIGCNFSDVFGGYFDCLGDEYYL